MAFVVQWRMHMGFQLPDPGLKGKFISLGVGRRFAPLVFVSRPQLSFGIPLLLPLPLLLGHPKHGTQTAFFRAMGAKAKRPYAKWPKAKQPQAKRPKAKRLKAKWPNID